MKLLYATLVFCSIGSTAFAQIPNPSFETWVDGDPEGWTTTNQAMPSVTQVPDAHDGSSAAQLDVISIAGFNFGGSMTVSSFPQTTVEPAIHGWYKGSFVSGDGISVIASINNSNDEVVVGGTLFEADNTDVWTEFVVNLNAGTGTDPSYGTIAIVLAGPNGALTGQHTGSTATVDDLTWGEQVVGVNEQEAASAGLEAVFPNPAGDGVTLVQYRLTQSGDVNMMIVDALGRPVMNVLNTHQGAGHYRAEFDASVLAAGTYSIVLQAGDQVFTLRFVKL